MKNDNYSLTIALLRQRAEELINRDNSLKRPSLADMSSEKLSHELKVYDIELQMQNAELQLAKEVAETTAEKYEQLYQKAYTLSSTGYFTIDSNAKILKINVSGARLLEKEHSIFGYCDLRLFVIPENLAIFNDFLFKIFTTKQKQSCEVRLSIDGIPSSFVYLEGIFSEMESTCDITAIDISNRIATEKQLRYNYTLLRFAGEMARFGGWSRDIVKKKIKWSDEVAAIHEMPAGYSPTYNEEIEFCVPEYRDRMTYLITDCVDFGISFDEEFEILTSKGKRIWVRAIGEAERNENGKIIKMHGAFQNISEYKLVEKKLKETKASLHELIATKDKFFSIIAHDLRSPFVAILGYSEILENQIQENDLHGIEKFSQIIYKSSVIAMDLLSDLMEWSYSQTGKMKFTPEDIDFVDLISGITSQLNYSALQKSITFHTETPNNIIVSADKGMVSSILRNLISNAVKFTKPGGEIIISAEQKPSELIVSVTDNGVGIKPEAIKKLFRIDGNYSTKGTENEKGTGLGLILCKNFIEKHGGEIRVESESGKGSKFWFTIPTIMPI